MSARVIDKIQVDKAWTGNSSGEEQDGMGWKEKVKVKMYGNEIAWNDVLM
jgi:hypothetical protein